MWWLLKGVMAKAKGGSKQFGGKGKAMPNTTEAERVGRNAMQNQMRGSSYAFTDPITGQDNRLKMPDLNRFK